MYINKIKKARLTQVSSTIITINRSIKTYESKNNNIYYIYIYKSVYKTVNFLKKNTRVNG